VVADLLSAAKAGAVNSDAASKAAEKLFNMVSSWVERRRENALPVRLAGDDAPIALNPR
jgi:hypothetical protein